MRSSRKVGGLRDFPSSAQFSHLNGVFEVVSDHKTDTFRAWYVVRFERALYVLHCFQKKSPSGTRTAKTDVEMIERRLKAAQADYEVRYGQASQKRQ